MQQNCITAIVNVTKETFDETVELLKSNDFPTYTLALILQRMMRIRMNCIKMYNRLFEEVTSASLNFEPIRNYDCLKPYEIVKEIINALIEDNVEKVKKIYDDNHYDYGYTSLYTIYNPHINATGIELSILCGAYKCFIMFRSYEYTISPDILYKCFNKKIFNALLSMKIIPSYDNLLKYGYILHNNLFTDEVFIMCNFDINTYTSFAINNNILENIIADYFELCCFDTIKELINKQHNIVINSIFKYTILYHSDEIMLYIKLQYKNITDVMINSSLLHFIMERNDWKELLEFIMLYVDKNEISKGGWNMFQYALTTYVLNKPPPYDDKSVMLITYLYDTHKFDIMYHTKNIESIHYLVTLIYNKCCMYISNYKTNDKQLEYVNDIKYLWLEISYDMKQQ